MIDDFYKIKMFLTVVRESSFSLASKKLGISQPAVTQHIQNIENYLKVKLVKRKRKGLVLTKEGEAFYNLCLEYERFIHDFERRVFQVLNKENEFKIATTSGIANYLIPKYVEKLKELTQSKIFIKSEEESELPKMVLNKEVDLAILEEEFFSDEVITHQIKGTELIFCSNKDLKKISIKEFKKINWICRGENSSTRKIVSKIFKRLKLNCRDLKIISTLTTDTAIKQTLLNATSTIITILPEYIVEDEIEAKRLFKVKISGMPKIEKNFYLIYLKENKHNEIHFEAIVEFFQSL